MFLNVFAISLCYFMVNFPFLSESQSPFEVVGLLGESIILAQAKGFSPKRSKTKPRIFA